MSIRFRAIPLLLTALLLLSGAVMADHPLHPIQGQPPVARFAIDLDVFAQNLAIAQGPDGLVYVGNADGLLTFDGAHWRHHPLPDGSRVLTLLHDGERLYVGGTERFGYVEHDQAGVPHFRDLTALFRPLMGEEGFGEIWDILPTRDGVYFRGLRHLFHYAHDDGATRLWHHPGRFGALATDADGLLLLQFREVGLKTLVDGRFELVAGGEQLSDFVFHLLPGADETLVAAAMDGRWLAYRDGGVETWTAPAGLPDANHFTAFAVLPDGSWALGGRSGDLYLLDPETSAYSRIGLGTDALQAITPSRVGGGLLVQTDLETLHVDWPPTWTLSDDDSGLMGHVTRFARWQDRKLILSTSGAFLLDQTDSKPSGLSLQRSNWTQFEAWDWLALAPDRALLAETYHLMEITPDGATAISDSSLYPRSMKRSRFDDRLIYVGTALGLAIARQSGDHWEWLRLPEKPAARILGIAEIAHGELLLASHHHGIIHVTLNTELDGIDQWRAVDAASGIDDGSGENGLCHLLRHRDGRITASTSGGLWQWDGDYFQAVSQPGLDAHRADHSPFHLREGPRGELWAFSHNRLLRHARDDEWERFEVAEALSRGAITELGFDRDGHVLVGSIGRLLFHHSGIRADHGEVPQVSLRRAILQHADGRREALALDPDRVHQLPRDHYALILELAVPDYATNSGVRFRSRLAGVEPEISDWYSSNLITYSFLSPGDYRFELWGQDGRGRTSEAAPFRFEILPPWYQTSWAYSLWGLLMVLSGVSLTVGVIRWRTYRISAEHRRLAEIVEGRTRQLSLANRRLKDMANIDGLTAIANRRRLDEYMTEALNHCRQEGVPLAILLLDVDHFKAYNDQGGHVAGDVALRQIALMLEEAPRRPEDLAARYGGEEFLLLMPGASETAAREVAEGIRRRVEASDLELTVSIGVSSRVPSRDDNCQRLIDSADQPLYRAKAEGRNRVVLAG
ncbi:ligand-binding sensor domain-containing diguanylate cyclase [Natronospira bacteriovora]|uniref:diguanylate cyclase n=1 Tax=Natronospira bacteriovora TaxID=3069753 RepID=A0ABU0W9U1_9GAMM|nr:diguanylate cyclase [Natronospira sp. AB-CW4]MDQ2070809.1 diguanylate cyclase [Natronospira sp. AB-CW4]